MSENNDINNCDVCRSHHEHHHHHDCDPHECDSKCGFGFACHHHRYILVRWILGLVILGIVFCLGVSVGKFSAWAEGDGYYGYGRMMTGGYGNARPMMLWSANGNAAYGPAMMYGWSTSGGQSAPTPTPASNK